MIPPDKRAEYPSLADDFAVLDRVVDKAFHDSDLAALRHQNRYRRQQVVVLLGSALVTGLGGVQAAFSDVRWPGVLLGALGIVLAASSKMSGELNALKDYLTERVKAERLRALYFRFLSRTGSYAGAQREKALRLAVVDIQSGKEPS